MQCEEITMEISARVFAVLLIVAVVLFSDYNERKEEGRRKTRKEAHGGGD